MALDQQETFNWLVERSNRLDQVEAENVQLQEELVVRTLELARLQVKHVVDRQNRAEELSNLWSLRFRALTKAEDALSGLCDECWPKHVGAFGVVQDALKKPPVVISLLHTLGYTEVSTEDLKGTVK